MDQRTPFAVQGSNKTKPEHLGEELSHLSHVVWFENGNYLEACLTTATDGNLSSERGIPDSVVDSTFTSFYLGRVTTGDISKGEHEQVHTERYRSNI